MLAILFFCHCSTTKTSISSDNNKAQKISMITLLSNPEKYDKKNIIIDGYFTFEKDGVAIYVNKTDYENLLYKNGIYLSITKDFLVNQDIQEPFKGYVTIEGTFNKDKLGSYNYFSGTLENIISISRKYKKGSLTDEYNMD